LPVSCEGMSPSEPEICSCSALRQASRHLTRMYDEALAPVGLGINQYAILSRLSRLGPIVQNELARRLVMDRSTLGHLLRPLLKRGLVEVAVDARDRRRKLLSLTDEGHERFAAAQPRWAQAQHAFEQAFGDDRSDQLGITLMQVSNIQPARSRT
jgi:DNA-binding MarR family transcriptional regulator